MSEAFTLSYPISSVTWDGSKIRRLPEAEISQSLDLMQRCGIHEVMITGYHVEEEADFDMDAETRRLGAELQRREMVAAQHHGLSATYAPAGLPQQEAVAHLCRCVDYTANLGARTLVLHSGRCLGRFAGVAAAIACFESECARLGRQRVIEICAENLRAAGDYARERGVLIAFENLDRFEPLGNLAELPQLLALADSPAVGFCLDSGHAHCAGNDPVKWVEVMGDKVFTTHFHDNHGPSEEVRKTTGFVTPKGIDEHLPPGFGTLSWVDLIIALTKSGYARTVNFESGAWPGWEAEEGLNLAIKYWRTSEHLAAAKLAKQAK